MMHGHRWLIGTAVVLALAAALALTSGGAPASLAENGIIYVDADAPGPTHNGSTWDFAYTDLQLALADADPGQQIWVAEGTYKPTSGTERAISFQMVDEVAIYGGFAGDETELGQRDWEANPTILSGDIGTEGNPDDNSYHVFYHPEELLLESTAVLDGFTITGGNANGGYPHDAGGGMSNHMNSSPAVTNVTFIGNSVTNFGGGMYNDGSRPRLTNCTFADNSASAGGGLHNSYSSPTLTNCSFTGNSAGTNGGGIYNSYSSPMLINCTFSGNSAGTHGGGIHNDFSFPTLTNCILWGDIGPEEIHNLNSEPVVTYSDIMGGYSGEENKDEDPLFMDPDNGDLHLRLGSPCIDAGTNDAPDPPGLPDYDFEGDPRILDGDGDGEPVVDMGVDEALWHRVYLPLVLKGY